MKASTPYNHHGSRDSGPPPSTVSEAEFEEIMKRNRAISSSAISKAVSGASAGDYSDAIETLLTAIAVIKQSRVANDERCRVLISSLKDCLHGIEAKSYSVGASGSSSRKRHRSRERSPSRSRESSRGTETCFITKTGMMIISKRGTGNMRDTGIENGTGTTEKGVWVEANCF